MEKEQKPKKKTMEQYVDEAAEKGAKKLIYLQRQQHGANLYRATERLLRRYPDRKNVIEHPEEFPFFPVGKSKSISIAPPAGSGIVDTIDLNDQFVEARKKAFEYEVFKLIQTETAIAPFLNHPAFIIIRMYYFNEDFHGNFRGSDVSPLTWEEIADELVGRGIVKSERSMYRWRSRLVQDICTMLFGVDGAVSIEGRDPNQGKKSRNGGGNHDGEEAEVHREIPVEGSR